MSAAFVLLIQSIILACAFVGRAFLAVSVFITRAPRTKHQMTASSVDRGSART